MKIFLQKHMLALLVASCLLLVACFPVSAGESILDKFLDGLETFSAAFEQQLINEYGEVLETSVGVVYLRRPGMFSWSYWEPYAQQIISDGKTLWIYDEDLEQVTIKDVVESVDDIPAAILTGDVRINDHYVVVDMGETEGIEWLELTPRDIDSQYSSMRIGFRGNELTAMVLFDNLGQKTQIILQKPNRNPILERNQFHFTPPQGVDVIDSRHNK